MVLLVQNVAMTLRRFFGWWFSELSLLAPAWMRGLFYAPRAQLFIRIKNFQVTFYCFEKEAEKELLSFYLHKEGKQQQDAFFKAHPEWQDASKILLLGPKQLLKKRLDLPLAAQENLAQVIGYEFDRYTPFSAEQCYFATQIVGKNKASNRLILELIFISRQKLNALCNELLGLGLSVELVGHESDSQQYRSNSFSPQYNLMPAEFRCNQGQNIKRIRHFFTACFLMLLGLAIALPFWLQQRTLTDLQQQVAVARHHAGEVEDIKAETNALLQVEKKIVALKQQAPVILNSIEQLSQLLPKDTWLKSFEYKDHKFLLQGLSASSSALIGLLEESPYFEQTAMVSPVTRNAQEAMDQFQLETYLEPAHDPG